MAPPLGVILLAAGYGTRLSRDVSCTPSLSHLSKTPKPLLPIASLPVLSHWLSQLPPTSHLIVVTNALHYPLYRSWASSAHGKHQGPIDIVSDGSTDNSNRLGAVRDIGIGLEAFAKTDVESVVIIAGDTLLPGVEFDDIVSEFLKGEFNVGVLGYRLKDMRDCVRRGMLRLKDLGRGEMVAEELVEKPQLGDSPSNFACAPVYMMKRPVWGSIEEFLKEKEGEGLEEKDAPGFWLGWMVGKMECRVFEVCGRVDIGGLAHYYDALWTLGKGQRATGEPAVGRGYPRVGLLGNPSDGYGGKVLGVAVASEGFAQVVATESEKFIVHWNKVHELEEEFSGLQEFAEHANDRGLFYGARTLVLAAAMVFTKEYEKYLRDVEGKDNGGGSVWKDVTNCQLSYSTTIPARIGLSGSSALVLATMRALARFYCTSLEKINPDIHVWPTLMRSAECDILGIPCGLQDRVVQVMQGCVAMDFTEGRQLGNDWERLPESSLPELWIAYGEGGRVGQCSGTVHSNLKARFEARDPALLDIVQGLIEIVDSGRQILEGRAQQKEDGLKGFAALINKNFELRLKLVGKKGLGKQNLELVSAAKEAGFAAKMTGSGGCVICVADPVRNLSKEEIEAATQSFKRYGIVLHKVEVLPRREWPKSN